MSSKTFIFPGMLLLFLISTLSCSMEDPGEDIPHISWESKTIYSYKYSGGVISGVNVYSKFKVSNMDGEVSIEASMGGESKSSTLMVQIDSTYTVKSSCNLSSGGGHLLILNSPSAENDYEYNFTDSKLKLADLSVY